MIRRTSPGFSGTGSLSGGLLAGAPLEAFPLLVTCAARVFRRPQLSCNRKTLGYECGFLSIISRIMPTLRDMIEARKRITNVRARPKSHPGHVQLNLSVDSEIDGLSIYLRLNTRLIELYSVGLWFQCSAKKSTVVLRVNGAHSAHRNPDGTALMCPHLHIPTEDEMPMAPHSAYDLKNAVSLGGECRFIYGGWDFFCQRVNVETNTAIAAVVSKMHTVAAQESLFDGTFD